ncbi:MULTISPECIES: hypothetical protein [Microbacterium]|uniref:PKD domain-containing protein n=1 Tax=Microbacterium wangchenii TaxID=2541726 RepID=A0ABX5STJ2_9MICO|nr:MULTISPECIES: hypothetical protein [Microbacterium]MCK6065022.1 hypothetical protein [Microbacterium sp. EYE_512]QBR88492.1 hypothetical protein E4K62_07205 [Microbacterium wangchenii]TXK20219.1 hypothetical protein FVP99_00820 [Microbacterium wangchenii]
MRLITVATLTMALLAPAATNAPTGCSGFGWQNACTSNSGSQIDIVGETTTPQRPPKGGGSSGGSDSTGPGSPSDAEALPPGCTLIGGGFAVCEPVEGEVLPGIPAVTARDVASFAPGGPALEGEPDGVGVVGMPVNFVASASAQSVSGTLFGRPVTVRFTPAAFVFDYGDGTTARSTSGGASWGDLGQAQFTPTATSHAYGERGVYQVAVSIEYSAEVDFGVGRWFPVNGPVTSTTAGYPVEVFEVRTALVDKTCAENPSGPAC